MPLILSIILTLLLFACSETSDPQGSGDVTVPGADTLAMSAYIDDAAWIGRDSMQVAHDPVSGTLVVNYSTTENRILQQTTIVLYGVTGPGTYAIDDSASGNARYLLREDKETSVFNGLGVIPAPTVTLTAFDNHHATGSFRFDAVAVSGARTGDTARVRGGRFNVGKPGG